MKNLSKLVRDAADHTFWRFELERAAEALGVEDRDDVEAAWQSLSDILDSLVVLAFDYRRDAASFGPMLKEWSDTQRALSRAYRDPSSKPFHSADAPQWLTLMVLWNLLDKVDEIYGKYEADVQGRQALGRLEPPKLDADEAACAREIASHLRKALVKVRHLQKCVPPSRLELDAYRGILSAVTQHFEQMAGVEDTWVEIAA